jgi:hypothetical protein
MPLSWNEIKSRALAFSKEWEDESIEDAEAKSFWDDFFKVLIYTALNNVFLHHDFRFPAVPPVRFGGFHTTRFPTE